LWNSLVEGETEGATEENLTPSAKHGKKVGGGNRKQQRDHCGEGQSWRNKNREGTNDAKGSLRT